MLSPKRLNLMIYKDEEIEQTLRGTQKNMKYSQDGTCLGGRNLSIIEI
jgi:hypothetical protein